MAAERITIRKAEGSVLEASAWMVGMNTLLFSVPGLGPYYWLLAQER